MKKTLLLMLLFGSLSFTVMAQNANFDAPSENL